MPRLESCPKCESTKIIPKVRMVDRGEYNVAGDLTVSFENTHHGRSRVRGGWWRAAEYMNAHDVAFDLAVLMDQARRKGAAYVKLEFRHYGKDAVHGGPLSKFVAGEIRRIALILRNYLPERAAGVNTILVNFDFGEATVQEEIKLPGWVAPQQGLFD